MAQRLGISVAGGLVAGLAAVSAYVMLQGDHVEEVDEEAQAEVENQKNKNKAQFEEQDAKDIEAIKKLLKEELN